LYPERADLHETWIDRAGTTVESVARARFPARHLFGIVDRVSTHGPRLAAMADDDLRREARALRLELRRYGLRKPAVARAFALVREVAERTIGMRHFDVQLAGGWALLEGMVAEMETGEGKTVTATLPASTAALAGIPVHVVTVNDYLARRDAEWMTPIYRFLGLGVGPVVHGTETSERRAAYACDVTYCCNKEIAFDYLRDRLVLGSHAGNLHLKMESLSGEASRTRRLLLRGLRYAIVDEADSVLIDEARTPLILSGQSEDVDEERLAGQALALAKTLNAGEHFRIIPAERRLELTDRGKDRLFDLAEPIGGPWRINLLREEMVRNALAALYLFIRDEHYLVRDDKVQIVDEYTGRILADRSWTAGLHQLVEVKEGCTVTPRKVTIAQMTYQRFFRRYQRLAGMTGTAREMAREFWTVYRLPVATIPTARPTRRRWLRQRILPATEDKWKAVTERVGELQRAGRPVLVGTRSVAGSEQASQHLTRARICHHVLNAAQDQDEAEIVAQAGEWGRVTIATNMAGRGTDIKLAAGVAELGGLHVIMSERHDAGRIDRQLAGRCGRQGDPGSVEAILSLDDPLLDVIRDGPVSRLAIAVAKRWRGRHFGWLFDKAQRKAERTHSRMRRELLKLDRKLGIMLAFAGKRE
jgi:preprotein translocase subunit SecA